MKQATLLWIPALPLIGAAFNLLFGRFMSRRTVHLVAVAAVAAAFFYAAYLIGWPLWDLSRPGAPTRPR
jgi:NADH:ubiquinone oxidoreductase subunit 5 (subunit L)/multisubunit Na+/H+ antiporter MnhA subunit